MSNGFGPDEVVNTLFSFALDKASPNLKKNMRALDDIVQQSCTNVRVGPERGQSTEELMLQTVVLEKTLESPLDYKDIKSVNSKGN